MLLFTKISLTAEWYRPDFPNHPLKLIQTHTHIAPICRNQVSQKILSEWLSLALEMHRMMIFSPKMILENISAYRTPRTKYWWSTARETLWYRNYYKNKIFGAQTQWARICTEKKSRKVGFFRRECFKIFLKWINMI